MKIPRFRWLIAILILIATTINYIDRQAISIAENAISREFGFTAQDYSWIVFWFLCAYAVMQAVMGRLIDKIGAKTGFSISVIWWSVANMLHFFGAGLISLSIYRVLLGIGEAGNFPAASKVISRWFPAHERSAAFGILTAGPGLGAIIAPPLVAFLIYATGWRWAFVITGALGFFWFVAWQILYSEPESNKFLTDEEHSLIVLGRDDSLNIGDRLPWREYLKKREVWGLILSRFVADGAFYFFLFFLPKYLTDERGFNLAMIGAFVWLPFLTADIGSILGGWTSGKLIDRGWKLDRARKIVMWIGALGVLTAFPVIYSDSAAIALVLICIALFFIQFKQAVLFTLPTDLFEERDVASVWGLTGMAGSFGGMLFAPVVGYLITNISYTPVFAIVSLMHVFSVIFVMLFVPRIRKISS